MAKWGGEEGYCRIIGAAVAADAMVAAWHFIRLSDSEESDVSMSARQGAELLHSLRCLLQEGGVFLESAEGTLTHAALAAMKSRTVLLGLGTGKETAMAMSWPAPAAVGRQKPIEQAKESIA